MLVSALAAWFSLAPAARAGAIDIKPFGLPAQQPVQQQPRLGRQEATLDQLIARVDIPYAFPQPVPLAGLRISGLGTRGIQMLGQNYFVVVNNSGFTDMAELYKDNRLKGKSNFVTADSIVHPYFAFTNFALAQVVEEHLAPELAALLKAMLEASVADYKKADDADVRDDIERNLAFLSVGLKLLDPSFAPPPVGRVAHLARADFEGVVAGRRGQSEIFDREEDFSGFQPQGWCSSNPTLKNFFRCREWISRMAFPVSDVNFGTQGGVGNNFRRSVLLFRTLDLAQVHGKPALETWEKILQSWELLGSPLAAWQERTISPLEYKPVFKTDARDLSVTLTSLAEPLFRTKLMLSIRKQKPVKLGATSIFELETAGFGSDMTANFRLFPVTGDPEMPWLRAVCQNWKEDGLEAPKWPLALLVLRAWGSPQANNVLADNIFKLDPQLAKALPHLDRSVTRRLGTGQLAPVEDRRWQILSSYFKPMPEGTQSALRTEMWANRRLESAIAGWVDSHLTMSSDSPDNAGDQANPHSGADHPGSGQAPPPARPAYFHYLEPCPELYRKIKEDADRLSENLYRLGHLSPKLRERFVDFSRFAQRLEQIADSELRAEPLPAADLKLLGNIDVILEKVVVPLSGTLSITSSDPDSSSQQPTGMSFALGRPGMLYIILQRGDRSVLARGAVYTYYEVPAVNIKPEHWQRKLDLALVKPPTWTERFDLIQEQAAPPRSTASGDRQ